MAVLRMEFWNIWSICDPARIRAILARAIVRQAWNCRLLPEASVPKSVIFGTVNRVSRRCSKNPKFHTFCQSPAGVTECSRSPLLATPARAEINYKRPNCGRNSVVEC